MVDTVTNKGDLGKLSSLAHLNIFEHSSVIIILNETLHFVSLILGEVGERVVSIHGRVFLA